MKKWLLFLSLLPSFLNAATIIAHRGASGYAPENTLGAFYYAWALDADAVEADFYLSLDERVVCSHDKNTFRTSGKSYDITRTSYQDVLSKLDFGKWRGLQWRNQPIPTLEEIIEILPPNKILVIEIKDSSRIVSYIKKILEQSGRKSDSFRIIAFDPEVIAESKKQLPQVKAYWLTFVNASKIESIFETLRLIHADGLNFYYGYPYTKNLIDRLHQEGYEAFLWTVNLALTGKRLIEEGADGITTNYPEKFLEFAQNNKKSEN